MIEFKYRPDIDGLRAIAVMLVLLFHAGFGFSGGFVGVDVFFVISGYLITGLILKEQQANTFSLAAFWERRIRRIIPAATFMVCATLIMGMLILLPSDLEDLANSAVAQQLMVSNFYFWNNTGYFDGPAELKPLLHTWSLAVEEQFYLGFPLLLLFGKRLKKRSLFLLLCCLAATSFAISEWGTLNHPSAAFFLLPPRAWEMIIGALVVFLPAPTRFNPIALNTLGAIGFSGILLSSITYSSTTRFPGLAALLPCLSTTLLIYANSQGRTYTYRFLSNRVLVSLGLLSYSLYLWHWPLLAYQRYWAGGTVSAVARAAALMGSLVLALISYKFVETPFRKKVILSTRKKAMLSAVASTLLILTFSLWVSNTKGLPNRLPENALRYAQNNSYPKEYESNTQTALNGKLPELGVTDQARHPVDFLVWGDSHALVTAKLCDKLAKEYNLRGIFAARAGVAPVLGTWRPVRGREAMEWNAAVLQQLREMNIKNVILVSRWAINIEGRTTGNLNSLIVDESSSSISPVVSKSVLRRGLQKTLAALAKENVKTWVMAQVPLQEKDPARQLVYAAWWNHQTPKGVNIQEHIQRQSNVSDVLNSFESSNVIILDPSSSCFGSNGFSRIGNSECSFYSDLDHLSARGAEELLSPVLRPVFAEIKHRTKELTERSDTKSE